MKFEELSPDSSLVDLRRFIDQKGLAVSKQVGPNHRTKADIYEDIKYIMKTKNSRHLGAKNPQRSTKGKFMVY
jgi:hypothetical protein